MKALKLALASLAAMATQPLAAQMERVPDRLASEGEGPFSTLLIRGATVVEGSGAPPAGPVDIVVEGNRIAALHPGAGAATCLTASFGSKPAYQNDAAK